MSELLHLDLKRLLPSKTPAQPPRFLLLYGSMRAHSFSHLVVEEAARILRHLGGETRIYDPAGLPMPGGDPLEAPPKVKELHEFMLWSDAQLWCSPENYGTMSAMLKVQLDSCPTMIGGKPLFAGKPLACAQVCGAGASFNTSVALATVGRWVGMFVTASQLCIPKVQEEFDSNGRLKPSSHYDQLVDLVEELYKVTIALRDARPNLIDHYSQRK